MKPNASISFLLSVARAAAALIGGFALLNVLGELVCKGFNANIWWLDTRPASLYLTAPLYLLAGAALVGFACAPRMSHWRRRVTGGVAFSLLIMTAMNAWTYYALRFSGQIHGGMWVPVSLCIALAMAMILLVIRWGRDVRQSPRTQLSFAAVFIGLTVLSPLVQMFGFGKTDYRRPADAVVVFGARTYANGQPSDALSDRVATACALYHEGLTPKLIFSGGPGDGGVHETEAMRTLAIRLGVPVEAIILDRDGLNTTQTVRNTAALCDRLGFKRVMVVSHFYHLPRIKLDYQRAGREVYTVPAKESYFLAWMPVFVAREVAADWVYYLRPLWT